MAESGEFPRGTRRGVGHANFHPFIQVRNCRMAMDAGDGGLFDVELYVPTN